MKTVKRPKEIMTKAKGQQIPLIVDISPLDRVESEDESLVESDTSMENICDKDPFLYKDDLIDTVKRSLADLKQEANLYIRSSDKAIAESNKKLKDSLFSTDSYIPDQETINIINELRLSIQMLHKRLEKNEEQYSEQRLESENLQEFLQKLDPKLKESPVLENSSKKITCSCTVV